MDLQIENYDQNKLRLVRKLANRQYFGRQQLANTNADTYWYKM